MAAVLAVFGEAAQAQALRPNFLFAISDDQSWHHWSGAGDPVLKTPHADRMAREGVRFGQFHVSSPSCSPSRAALLTGRNFWELGSGSTLWARFPSGHPTFPKALRDAGYAVGLEGKGWDPGEMAGGGENLAGPAVSFQDFLDSLPAGKPFSFWFGSQEPHRPYAKGSGAAAGLDEGKVKVPPHFPDAKAVRQDMLDYYREIELFDRKLGEKLALLEAKGLLQNTMVIVTSDNGMPFPRSKSNLYDYGTRVPLIIRWPGKAAPNREIDDFVQAIDLGPTLLEAAGVPVPTAFRGKSLVPILVSERSGRVEGGRRRALFGLNRHTWARENNAGYTMRGLRTYDHLYIRNFQPNRWPAGNPPYFRDIDEGPTKAYMDSNRTIPKVDTLFRLATDCRPGEELYDLRLDPGQLHNVAGLEAYRGIRDSLSRELLGELIRTGDPAASGDFAEGDKNGWVGAEYPGIGPVAPGTPFVWPAPFPGPVGLGPVVQPGTGTLESGTPSGRDVLGRRLPTQGYPRRGMGVP